MNDQNNMQKLEDEYFNLLKNASPELVDFIFSNKTVEKITDICLENNIDDEQKIAGIAFRMVWVLSGRLPKENLSFTFESGLKIPAEASKKIADEVNQFISPFIVQSRPEVTTWHKKELPNKKIIIEEETKRPQRKDTYREPIE